MLDMETWDALRARRNVRTYEDRPISGDDLAHGRAAAELLERHRRSEEHTSELQSLYTISYAVFCLKKKRKAHV